MSRTSVGQYYFPETNLRNVQVASCANWGGVWTSRGLVYSARELASFLQNLTHFSYGISPFPSSFKLPLGLTCITPHQPAQWVKLAWGWTSCVHGMRKGGMEGSDWSAALPLVQETAEHVPKLCSRQWESFCDPSFNGNLLLKRWSAWNLLDFSWPDKPKPLNVLLVSFW